ncbi:hypothetical protein Tco_0046322 [Tanacetum coccineum]
MLVQNQAPEGEGSTVHLEPQPTPSTSQPNVSEPQIASLHIETSPTAAPQTEAHQTAVSQIVFHEAHIEQILPSPTTYQRKRKTQKCRRTKKDTELPQTSVPLDHGADEAVHKEGVTGMDTGGSPRRQETMGGTPAQTRSERVLAQPNEPPLSEGHTSGSGEGRMENIFELTDNVPSTPHDSPLPGGYPPGSEGRMKLDELITVCIKLSKQVLDLEKEKDAQTVKILNLKRRVKKLERKRKSSISHPRRRKYRQVETSSDDGLDEEDASKQGILEAEEDSTMEFELIKIIKSMLEERSLSTSDTPWTLIPLRPNFMVLQIGIKSQGYREPEEDDEDPEEDPADYPADRDDDEDDDDDEDEN